MENIERFLDERRVIILSVLIGIFTALLWVEGVSPWLGRSHHANCGVRSSLFAKNYIRYGYLKTKFAPVMDYGNSFPEKPNYYVHHPPFVFLLTSFSFLIFGVHSWAARLIPIAASVGSLLLVYAIAKRWWGCWCATLAACLFVFMPMTSIYGSMVNNESPTVFFMLLSLYYYQKWFDNRTRRDLRFLGGSIFLANFSGWAAFFLAPLLIIHHRISDRTGFDRSLVRILGGAVLFFGVLMFCQIFFVADLFGDMIKIFLMRVGSSGETYTITWKGLFRLTSFRAVYFFTPYLLITAGAGLAVSFFPDNYNPKKAYLLPVLFCPSFFYTIMFRHGAQVHDWWIYYASPFFVLSAAVFLAWLFERSGKKKVVFGGTVIFILVFSIHSLHTFNNFFQFVGLKRNLRLYDVAQRINRTIKEDRKVIMVKSYPTFFAYYLDRPYIVSSNPSDIDRIIAEDSSYGYIISPVRLTELNKNLALSYPSNKYDNFLVFDIQNPATAK